MKDRRSGGRFLQADVGDWTPPSACFVNRNVIILGKKMPKIIFLSQKMFIFVLGYHT